MTDCGTGRTRGYDKQVARCSFSRRRRIDNLTPCTKQLIIAAFCIIVQRNHVAQDKPRGIHYTVVEFVLRAPTRSAIWEAAKNTTRSIAGILDQMHKRTTPHCLVITLPLWLSIGHVRGVFYSWRARIFPQLCGLHNNTIVAESCSS